jgi:hypothetical protein
MRFWKAGIARLSARRDSRSDLTTTRDEEMGWRSQENYELHHLWLVTRRLDPSCWCLLSTDE